MSSGSARIFSPWGIFLLELKTGRFLKKRGAPPQNRRGFLLWRGIFAACAVFATAGYEEQVPDIHSKISTGCSDLLHQPPGTAFTLAS